MLEEVYKLDNGEECSRSAFIRQEFLKDRSRSEIAKELDVPYYIVYSATANMYNEVHKEGENRRPGGNRGVMVEDPETGETISRAEAMRRMYAEGKTRSEIKEHFGTPYSTVYAATKDVEPPEGAPRGGRIMVEHPETGEQVQRVELIRECYEQGQSRREIADLIGCDYSVVWAATRELKPLEEDTDKVEDVEDVEDFEEDLDEDFDEDFE